MAAKSEYKHAQIEIRGLVQGVNFRETVRQIATVMELVGEVWNDTSDVQLVHLEVAGKRTEIEELLGIIKEMKRPKPKKGEILGPRYHAHVRSAEIVKSKPLDDPKEAGFIDFRVRPLPDISPVNQEILQKLSTGATFLHAFNDDHNYNFVTLRNNFGDIGKKIEKVGKDIKDIKKSAKKLDLLVES